jgi:murein L,D-transpeptidase YcbB/YkuD
VQNPDRLAQEIITADKLTQNGKLDVLELIHSNNPSDVYLHEPLAIYIRYFTCTSDSLGNVIFHPDIYSLDEMPIRQLFANSEL